MPRRVRFRVSVRHLIVLLLFRERGSPPRERGHRVWWKGKLHRNGSWSEPWLGIGGSLGRLIKPADPHFWICRIGGVPHLPKVSEIL